MMRSRNAGLLSFSSWTLYAKTMALILSGILLAGVVILVASLGRTGETVRGQVQEKFALAAASKTKSVADALTESLTVLRGIAADHLVRAVCDAANIKHNAGYVSYLGGMNQQWLRSDDNSQLVQSVISPDANPATLQLRRHISGLPEFVQVMVTDSVGAVVASTQRSDLYYQGSSLWWLSLYNEGQGRPYLGIYRPVGSPDAYKYFEIAVPIYRDAGTRQELIGSVYARIHSGLLLEAIQGENPSAAAQTLIIDANAQAIVATESDQIGTIIDSSWWQRQYALNQQQHFHEAQTITGLPVLLGHASMSGLALARDDDAVALKGLGWILYVYEPTRSAYAAARHITMAIWAWGGSALLVVALVSFILSRSFTQPFQNLMSFVDRLGKTSADHAVTGNRATTGPRLGPRDRAWIYPHREAGALAQALNGLLDERDELLAALATNNDLMVSDQARRQRDVELTSSIGELVAASTDVATLSQRAVDLTREHYGLYYAGLYRVDDANRWAVLQAGTGEPGRELLARSHRIAVGSGLVGQCVATGRVQLERDLSTIANRGDEQCLPYARSEVAVPLRSRGVVLGVLVADSYQSDTFDDEMVVALRVIADQVAVAIDSLRLYAESQAATERLQRAYGELTRQSWLDALGGRSGGGYEAAATGVQPLQDLHPESWISYQRDAWTEGRSVVVGTLDRAGVSTQRCVIPIHIRDEVVGVLDVSKLSTDGDWSQVELAELEGLADQLGQALESARLYEAAQRSAREELLVGGATRRLRETLNVDTVLQTAVQELRALLDLDGIEIRVTPVDVAVSDTVAEEAEA